MESLLEIARRVEQAQKSQTEQEHQPPATPTEEVNSSNSSFSYAEVMTWPAVYLDDNGDLRFADPAEEQAWWASDDESPSWQDLLAVAGVARNDLERWSADPIGWQRAWKAAGRPCHLDILRAKVRATWRQAELTPTTDLLSAILGRPITSVKEAFVTANAADLARLLRYGRHGRLEGAPGHQDCDHLRTNEDV